MHTNLLNLWILARLTQAAVATLLCLVGVVFGLSLWRRWQAGQASERQLALERQAELVASMIQVALLLEVVGLGLSVFVADHLVGSIRGAMCAFGVLASTRAGFPSLLLSALTAGACALWVVLHRLDLRLEAPVLTRRKFAWLPLVGALALGDLALVLVFAGQLDFKVVASCCSVWVDAAVVNHHPAVRLLAPTPAGVVGVTAATLATLASAAAARWPAPLAAWLACGTSAVGVVAVLPAILGVVAPHALGTPSHLCPFCLFHSQGGGIGWPLFGALFLGGVTGVGLGVVELNRAAANDQAAVGAMERTLGRWSAGAWGCALACGAWPVAHYWVQSGGVTVFGKF